MNTRRHTRHWYWLVLVVAVPALLMIAVPLGVLKVEIHNPDWLFQFVLANIFFVSLAEDEEIEFIHLLPRTMNLHKNQYGYAITLIYFHIT